MNTFTGLVYKSFITKNVSLPEQEEKKNSKNDKWTINLGTHKMFSVTLNRDQAGCAKSIQRAAGCGLCNISECYVSIHKTGTP